MKEEIKEIIKGYNEEKKILSERLGQLRTENATIATRASIEYRLREIDKMIEKIITPTPHKENV